MIFPFVLAASLGFLQLSEARDVKLSTRDAAIPGNYSGPLRPQVHYSPPKGFMNDPNGMFVDAGGVWHLYYQYNPTDIVAGNQHWGHATSDDLYHWVNQAIALAPASPDEGIFSGSAVIDVNNTSGFFPNQTNGVVAIYTLNTADKQAQEIAYSTDGGYTFTKYAQNPVLDLNNTQFRDPKVIWHADTEKWVMSVSLASEFTVQFYTSPDLKEWTFASNFSHAGWLGIQYECPNMVSIPMEGSDELFYVLFLSINPGAPLGGSMNQYFPGRFNGTHFVPVDAAARAVDFGKDYYAAQFFYGTPDGESPIGIGWASNWQYAGDVPTGPLEGWRSSMTVPRAMTLANGTSRPYALISKPYDMGPILDSELASNSSVGNGTITVNYANVSSGALYFEVNLSSATDTTDTSGAANFTFTSSKTGESIEGGFLSGSPGSFWLNRGNTDGFDNVFFTDKFSTAIEVDDGQWRLTGIIDRSIIEVYPDGGYQAATTTFFTESPLDTMVFATSGWDDESRISFSAWGLKSGWAGDGTNATAKDVFVYDH